MRRALQASGLAIMSIGLALTWALPAQAQAKVGERFGDWVFNCTAIAQNQTSCSLNQALVNKQTQKVVARFSVVREQETNRPALIAILPLGIDLTTSVMGAVDENDAFKFTMETCTRAGCFAKVILEDGLLGQMKNGKLLTATFTARRVQ